MSTENMVGKQITFKDWKGDTREGEITAILKNGDYEVSTDRGIALVTNSEILKMKRGGYVPKATQMKRAKVAEVMHEFKEGKLHSGSKNGPIVKDRDQAIAIALAEANSKKMGRGGDLPSIKGLKKLNAKRFHQGTDYIYHDMTTDKFYFVDFEGDVMEIKNDYFLSEIKKFYKMEKNDAMGWKHKMAKGGGIHEADTIMYVELQSVGNVDFGDSSERHKNIPMKKVYVDSIEEAQDVVQQFIERHDLGGGNWTGGKVFKDGKNIGYIAYNGRFFEGARPYANGGSTADQYNVSIDWEQNKPKLKYGRKFFKNIYANSNEEAEKIASEQWNNVKANSNKKVLSINSINMTQLRKKPILDKPERKMATGGGIDKTEKMGKITISDIISGAKFKAKSGTVFIVDSIENDPKFGQLVNSSFEGGAKGNYRDPIGDFVAFMNEQKATRVMSTGGSMYAGGGAIPKYLPSTKSEIDALPKMGSSAKDGWEFNQMETHYREVLMNNLMFHNRIPGRETKVVVEKRIVPTIEGNRIDTGWTLYIRDNKKSDGGSMYADGGGVSKYSVDEYDLEKLQSSGVTINQMNEILKKSFPDSFGFTLYPVKDDSPSNYRYLIPNTDDYYGIKDASLKISFNRYHGMSYRVYQGGENTYFYFILDGSDGNGYIGSFGFKDQGDVPKEYVTSFTALLNKLYGFPFQVSHEVYAKGGSADRSDIYVPVNKEVTKERIDDFVNYVEMFYGKDEDAMGKDGYTKAQIRTAVKKYLLDLDAQKAYTWGNGDSLDRERVFPYLMNPSQKGIKNPSFAKGGGLSSFNPKSFTLDELKDYLWKNDIYISWFQKGWTGITSASKIERIWDGTSHSSVLKQWKDKKLTISDYGQLEFSKGDENLYLTLIVYQLEGTDEPYEIRIYTKENHKVLKEFANHIIDKFKKGGSMGWKHKMK